MPFINQETRETLPDSCNASIDVKAAESPGERAYIYYRSMMRIWRRNPRWKTADMLLMHLIPDDNRRAEALAFLTFFCLHVMPYEEKKRRENGEVE